MQRTGCIRADFCVTACGKPMDLRVEQITCYLGCLLRFADGLVSQCHRKFSMFRLDLGRQYILQSLRHLLTSSTPITDSSLSQLKLLPASSPYRDLEPCLVFDRV